MNLLDSLEFTLRLTFYSADSSIWIWVIVSFLLVFVVLGYLWGRAWNQRWAYSNHIGQSVLSLVLALLTAYAVMNWRASQQVERWLGNQWDPIIRSIADAGTFNRNVLRKTWEKLQPLGGQQDLTPPVEGGNELRLNSPEEALVLATTAAAETKDPLRSKVPFVWGCVLTLKDPSLIAAEVAEVVPAPTYPVVVSPANVWTKSAAAIQAGYALDVCRKSIHAPMVFLRTAAGWLFAILLVLQFLLISIAALNDIKTHPKTRP